MSNLKPFSPQSEAIYKHLLITGELSAKEIGVRLNILPNAVYRAIKPLISSGLVKKLDKYPVEFGVTDFDQALNSYLLNTREAFLTKFFPNGVGNDKGVKGLLNVSFIKNRQELLERSNEDMSKAKSRVNLIVSGLEVPAETVLAYKRACERGVRIRTLVQRLDEVNKEMLKNWRKVGIDVRFFPLLEARVIVFDLQIVYIISYNPNKQDEGVGVRFDYPPIAKIMDELFEERWKKSGEIK